MMGKALRDGELCGVGGYAPKVVANCLRLLNESRQGNRNIHRFRKLGVAKAYLQSDLILVCEIGVPLPPYKLSLAAFRVDPSTNIHLEALGAHHQAARNSGSGQSTGNSESDSMFVVRDFGERTDQVVTAGVGIRSLVWLMLPNDMGNPIIDFPPSQPSFQVSRTRGPGKILIGRSTLDDCSRGKQGLVKTVPSVRQGFSGLPSCLFRNLSLKKQMQDVLTGARIEILDNFVRVSLKEVGERRAKLNGCAFSPVNEFLGRLEGFAN